MFRYTFLLLFILTSVPTVAQELFHVDFEDEFVPDDWEFTGKSEWCHVLGEEGSSFFRFHPFSWRDVLQTPSLDLEEGYYVLYYSWNEAGMGNPDFSNIRIRENDGYWESLDRIGVGNERNWQKDSTVIGPLAASNYTFEFEYKSLGHFPSEYLNLDNISLVRRDIVTGLHEDRTDIKFEIYPNPVRSILNYRLGDDLNRTFEMIVINELGQSVSIEEQIAGREQGSIDVSGLPQGLYTLEIKHEQGRATSRFVIQR